MRDSETGEEGILLRFADGPLAEGGNLLDLMGGRTTSMVPASALGGWPPPPYLLVAPVPSGAAVGVIPVREITEKVRGVLEDREGDELVLYRRLRMSQLGDDVADMNHLARGAEYELADLGQEDV